MTTPIPQIEGLKLNVLSRYIDWTDKTRPQFKYIVEVVRGNERMSCDYSGGILAFYDRKTSRYGLNVRVAEAVKAILSGKNLIFAPHDKGDIALRALEFIFSRSNPSLNDVLHCLIMDAQAGSESFEDFCAEFGYDEDSRAHYAIWEACKKNSKNIRRVLGKEFDAIAETLQDY